MGTWSISPNTGLVSINQLGVVTYQEHTENKNYTIKYSDSTCGEITKSITINKCVSPTKRVEIRYTVQFTNIEKGSVDVTLKVPNKNINISVTSAGGTGTSGKKTGIAKFDVDSSWTDEQILNAIDFDLPNMVATLRHETTNYDMRWNGTCLSCDIPDSQCNAFNPWPDICGPCKVCAAVNYGIEIDNIAMTVTGGMCDVSPSTSKANVLIMNDNHQSINIASLTFHIGLNSYKATPDGSGTVSQCDSAELISTVTPALPENPTFGMSVNAKLADGSSINGTFEGYTPGNPPTLSAKLGNNGCI